MSARAPVVATHATAVPNAPSWCVTDAACVRRVIARAWLADSGRSSPGVHASVVLGDVTLLPHQVEAVARLRSALAEFGGALLADETGLGKSFVALALAREARRALVVAPAGLRAAWGEALRRAGLCIPFRSAESLGRRAPPAADTRADLVIVDEAHHFRNPRTCRYRRLAGLARGARVLLLSATPVHNRAAELHAQLALFLGAAAATLDEAALARCIVRRGEGVLRATSHVPRIRGPLWLPAATDEGILARLLALPPPLPPGDGGDGGALVVHGLVRRWSSSVGALRGALRRRLVRAEALTAALEAGHHPTLAELRRWVVADDTVQLDFPELLAAHDAAAPVARLLRTVRAHAAALRALLAALRDAGDEPRAHQLRRVRARHAGERLVAFSEHADTVDAFYRLLARDGGACALTGAGARVAGGALSRAEALRRFAPLAHGAAPPPPAERITLLLSTDVLSEGIGLQDASVVVHLDLPWTPARLEQRVGRVARLGSPHAEVSVYAFAPPPGAEAVLGVERTLRAKRDDAARLVGAPAHALPAAALEPDGATRSIPELDEALLATFRRWLGTAADGTTWDGDPAAPSGHESPSHAARPVVAAVASPAVQCAALLALLAGGGHVALLAGELADAGLDHPAAPPSDAPAALSRVAACAGGADVAVEAMLVHRALAAIEAWRSTKAGCDALGVVARDGASLRRTLLRRVAAAEREAPRHRRTAVARLAADARRALAARFGAGTERALGELLADGTSGEAWLAAVVACVEEGAPQRTGGTVAARDPTAASLLTDAPPTLRALLLVTPAA